MNEQPEKPKKLEVRSLAKLQEIFDEQMLWADRNVLRLLTATVIGNQMVGDPIWLVIVSASSGGKTELLSSLDTLRIDNKDTIFQIADITQNAFLSGAKRAGVETSLLHRTRPGGLLIFKDFTTLLSKRWEDRSIIFGQLRQIYDGDFNKPVGTGDDLHWTGKVGSIAASTEAVHKHMEEMAAMGHRFVFYSMMQPDRKKVLQLMLDKKEAGIDNKSLRDKRAAAMKSYIEWIVPRVREMKLNLSREMQDNLIKVADFCTIARSAVDVDKYKNLVNFVPAVDMPMRMFEQLLMLAQTFEAIERVEKADIPKGPNESYIRDADMELLYKIAFDSIPLTRRIALKYLSVYEENGVSTAGLATETGYPTEVVKGWLAELNALRICDRIKSSGPQGDTWKIRKEYAEVMLKFQHLKRRDGMLTDESILSAEEEQDMLMEEALRKDEHLEALASQESFDPVDV